MIDPLKLVITLYFPLIIISINYYVGIAFIKYIFNLPMDRVINKFLIASIIRIVVVASTSVLMYYIECIYVLPFFIWLFFLYFLFKIIEVLKINKMTDKKTEMLS